MEVSAAERGSGAVEAALVSESPDASQLARVPACRAPTK
jgi:hypothetical protein